MYYTIVIKSKCHNFLFIEKLNKPYNDKILICPLNNITYYFRLILEIYSIKFLLDCF
jgi:hypothetical protein